MKIGREEAKQMFRDDKNSQGCYRSVMTKINKIYDSFEEDNKQVENNDTLPIVSLSDGIESRELLMEFILYVQEKMWDEDNGDITLYVDKWLKLH